MNYDPKYNSVKPITEALTRLSGFNICQRLSPKDQTASQIDRTEELMATLKQYAGLRHDSLERLHNRRHGVDHKAGTTARHEDTAMEEPVTAAIPQKDLLDAYARRVQAGRNTGCGAGVLLYSKATGRFLFVKRSDRGDAAGTWCTGGGGVEDHETIDQAVRRENQEELGYDGDYDLIHMHRDIQPDGFTFHNHMAVVPDEFEPQLNDEHTDYVWAEEPPQPLHPGLERSLAAWSARNQATNPQA